ncbi:hypothetical protein WA026_020803 [Henosepilachna vigintioctopunctata]|uniref:Uncharacterized protein n=1 Tax=Henosepilachna vigintioctopunctata TaxID=420089 RepID=A0AAW1TNH7_9CUCU
MSRGGVSAITCAASIDTVLYQLITLSKMVFCTLRSIPLYFAIFTAPLQAATAYMAVLCTTVDNNLLHVLLGPLTLGISLLMKSDWVAFFLTNAVTCAPNFKPLSRMTPRYFRCFTEATSTPSRVTLIPETFLGPLPCFAPLVSI